MKKNVKRDDAAKPEITQEPNDELKEFIRKKNIQNKVLKEMIDKIKNSK